MRQKNGCVSFDLPVTGAPPDDRLAATKWARRRRRQNTPGETPSHTCAPLLFCRSHEVSRQPQRKPVRNTQITDSKRFPYSQQHQHPRWNSFRQTCAPSSRQRCLQPLGKACLLSKSQPLQPRRFLCVLPRPALQHERSGNRRRPREPLGTRVYAKQWREKFFNRTRAKYVFEDRLAILYLRH